MEKDPIKGKVTFKVGNDKYDIDPSEKDAFLADFPDAEELLSFTVGKDTFDISPSQKDEFLSDFPDAQPTFSSPQKKNSVGSPSQGGLQGSQDGIIAPSGGTEIPPAALPGLGGIEAPQQSNLGAIGQTLEAGPREDVGQYFLDGKPVSRSKMLKSLQDRSFVDSIAAGAGRDRIDIRGDQALTEFAQRQFQSRKTNDTFDSLMLSIARGGQMAIGAVEYVDDLVSELTGVPNALYTAVGSVAGPNAAAVAATGAPKEAVAGAIDKFRKDAEYAEQQRFQVEGDFIDLVSKGDFEEAANMAINTTAESAIPSLLIGLGTAVTGGGAGFAALARGGAAVTPLFIGGEYVEQKAQMDDIRKRLTESQKFLSTSPTPTRDEIALMNLSKAGQYLRPAARGTAEMGGEVLSFGIWKGTAKLATQSMKSLVGKTGATLGKEAAEEAAKVGAGALAKNLLGSMAIDPATEGFAELGTFAAQELTDVLLGVSTKSPARIMREGLNAWALGAASGGVMTAPGTATTGILLTGKGLTNAKKYLDNILAFDPSGLSELNNAVSAMRERGQEQQANVIEEGLAKREKAVKAVPEENVSDTETVDLVQEKQELNEKKRNLDPIYHPPIDARIITINERLMAINERSIQALNAQMAAIDKELRERIKKEYPAPTINTSPTEAKYASVNRNDGKGTIDLTKEEYLAEMERRGTPVEEVTKTKAENKTESLQQEKTSTEQKMEDEIAKARDPFYYAPPLPFPDGLARTPNNEKRWKEEQEARIKEQMNEAEAAVREKYAPQLQGVDEKIRQSNKPTKSELTDSEYSDFIDNGIVSEERLMSIAEKVKAREQLSPREMEMFSDKTSEINKMIAGSQSNKATPTEPTTQPSKEPVSESELNKEETEDQRQVREYSEWKQKLPPKIETLKKMSAEEVVADIISRPLIHAGGLGMESTEAIGTYVSTETRGNRYAKNAKKIYKADVTIKNPIVKGGGLVYEVHSKERIQKALDEMLENGDIDPSTREALRDANTIDHESLDLLGPNLRKMSETAASIFTDELMDKGYDSIYIPESEAREGYLIVFDKGNVKLTEVKDQKEVVDNAPINKPTQDALQEPSAETRPVRQEQGTRQGVREEDTQGQETPQEGEAVREEVVSEQLDGIDPELLEMFENAVAMEERREEAMTPRNQARAKAQLYNGLGKRDRKSPQGVKLLAEIQQIARENGYRVKVKMGGAMVVVDENNKEIRRKPVRRSAEAIANSKEDKAYRNFILNQDPVSPEHLAAILVARGARFYKKGLIDAGDEKMGYPRWMVSKEKGKGIVIEKFYEIADMFNFNTDSEKWANEHMAKFVDALNSFASEKTGKEDAFEEAEKIYQFQVNGGEVHGEGMTDEDIRQRNEYYGYTATDQDIAEVGELNRLTDEEIAELLSDTDSINQYENSQQFIQDAEQYAKKSLQEATEPKQGKDDSNLLRAQEERKAVSRSDKGLPDRPSEEPRAAARPDRGDRTARPGLVVATREKVPTPDNFIEEGDFPIDAEQLFAVNVAMTRFKSGKDKDFMLADGTGVGKTRQILAIADTYKKEFGKPVLIVSENKQILENNFADDAKAMGIDPKSFDMATYADIRTGKVKGPYGLILFDEAHNLKNPESDQTIAANSIERSHTLYATATPMDTVAGSAYFISRVTNMSLDDVYRRIGFKVELKKLDDGRVVRSLVLEKGTDPKVIRANIVSLRDEMIESGAMLRREYPFWGVIQEASANLTSEQESEISEIEDYWEEVEEEARGENGSIPPKKLMSIRGQRSGELSRWNESQKVKYVFDGVKKALKEGKKVVVIAEGINSTYIKGIDREVPGFIGSLEKLLEKEGVSVAKIYGDNNKTEANRAFQEGTADVVLGTAKSASTGINLDDQVGDAPRKLFMVTPNYSGNIFQQILGRVSRRNTKSPAEVELVFNDSSSDTRRKEIVSGKLATLKAIQEGIIEDDVNLDGVRVEDESSAKSEGVYLEDISDKAFVVKGDTFRIKDQLKALGGRWNGAQKAWMFPKSKKSEIEKAVIDQQIEALKAKIREDLNKSGFAFDPKNSAEDAKQLGKDISQLLSLYLQKGAISAEVFARAIRTLYEKSKKGISKENLDFIYDRAVEIFNSTVQAIKEAETPTRKEVKKEGKELSKKAKSVANDIRKGAAEYTSPEGRKQTDDKFNETHDKAFKDAEEELSGIMNELVPEDKKGQFQKEKRTVAETLERGKALIESGAIDPWRFMQSILKSPRPLTADETAAMVYYKASLDARIDSLTKQSNEAREKGDAEGVSLAELAISETEAYIDDYYKFQEATGYEQGLSLRMRQLLLTKEYELANQVRKFKKATGKSFVPPEILEKFKMYDEAIRELDKRIDEFEKRSDKASQKLEILSEPKGGLEPKESAAKQLATKLRRAKFVKSVKDLSSLQSDPTGLFKFAWDGAIEVIATTIEQGGAIADAIDKALVHLKESDWYKNLSSQGKSKFDSTARQTISQEVMEGAGITSPVLEDGLLTIPDSFIKNLIKEGYDTIESATEQTMKFLSENLGIEVTERQVRDAISNYGKRSKLSKDEVDQKMREMKRVGKLLSALEDVQQKKRPLRSGRERDALTQKEREMRREINNLLKDIPQTSEETESAWKSALDATKKRLRNRIEDLQTQIAQGKKTPKKNTLELDAETKYLKEEVSRLNEVLRSIEGKPEMSFEQKVRITEQAIERSIAEYERRIREKDFDPLQKTPVSTPEIEALKQRREQLRKQYSEEFKASSAFDTARDSAALKRLQKQIDDLNDKIHGRIAIESRREAAREYGAHVKAMQDRVKSLREALRETDQFKIIAERKALENMKKAARRSIAEYERRIREKDFAVRKPADVALDAEAKALKAEQQKWKNKFDAEREKNRLDERSRTEKIREYLVDVIGVPKSLVASLDFSSVLRQGGMLSARNPRMAVSATKEMLRQTFSEAKYEKWMDELMVSDIYADAKKAGLYIASPNAKLLAKEESFVSNISEQIPIYGKLVRASNRAYSSYLNTMRIAVFEDFKNQIDKSGLSEKDAQLALKDMAVFINNATGRGSIFDYEPNSPELNILFFSPRFVLSRANIVMNTATGYAAYHPRVRKEALLTVASYVSAVTTLILLSMAAGADGEDDPRSSDFGKIKIGNLRLDPFAGLSQMVVFLSRMLSGQTKSIKTGEIKSLGEGGFFSRNRLDVVGSFIRSKMSPAASAVVDFADAPSDKKKTYGVPGLAEFEWRVYFKNIVGEEQTLPERVVSMTIPIYTQDILEIYEKEGLLMTAAATGSDIIGIGSQYHSDEENSKGVLEGEAETAMKQAEKQESDAKTAAKNNLVSFISKKAGNRIISYDEKRDLEQRKDIDAEFTKFWKEHKESARKEVFEMHNVNIFKKTADKKLVEAFTTEDSKTFSNLDEAAARYVDRFGPKLIPSHETLIDRMYPLDKKVDTFKEKLIAAEKLKQERSKK